MEYFPQMLAIILALTVMTSSDPAAQRLYRDMLMSGYNKHARPRHSENESITQVKMGVSLESVVDVDMKNQILTTHIWLEHEWQDYTMRWNPEDYGGIDRMYVPPDRIWKPDIVLYNSADGNFTVNAATKYKVIVHHTGRLIWRPPVIFKSLCKIDIEFFPFDTQNCHLKLGSWTHDTEVLDIYHKKKSANDSMGLVTFGIELDRFSSSAEWDLMSVTAERFAPKYPCCEYTFPDIKFFMRLRRKPLFYLINLIIPCVCICSVAVLVFYIPAQSAEKVTMGITVLNSLTVFLLLVAEISPPTSLATPLIGKYLVFTMGLVTLSIVVTVLVLNVHFGSPIVRKMPTWVRYVFLNKLPKLLMLRPPQEKLKITYKSNHDLVDGEELYNETEHLSPNKPVSFGAFGRPTYGELRALPKPVVNSMIGVSNIADTLKKAEEDKQEHHEWQYVAMVIDRLFLYLFMTACALGTLYTILHAPSHYDHSPGLDTMEAECHPSLSGRRKCWYE